MSEHIVLRPATCIACKTTGRTSQPRSQRWLCEACAIAVREALTRLVAT